MPQGSSNFIDSSMTLSESDNRFLAQQIKAVHGKNFTAKLLWRGTRDGINFESFHAKVDSKGPTISFYKSAKGARFGGYTSQNIQKCTYGSKGNEYLYPDTYAFLFNLDSKMNFPVKDPSAALLCTNYNIFGFGWGWGELLMAIKDEVHSNANA